MGWVAASRGLSGHSPYPEANRCGPHDVPKKKEEPLPDLAERGKGVMNCASAPSSMRGGPFAFPLLDVLAPPEIAFGATKEYRRKWRIGSGCEAKYDGDYGGYRQQWEPTVK
jgi:hypothetical protein